MFDAYFNTPIDWKQRSGVKDNGTSVLAVPKQIMTQLEFKRKLVRNEKGEQVVSEATVRTDAQIKAADVLTIDGRDWTVITADPIRGLGGSVLYYEANL